MRARIVPRFENAARDLFSSKPTRGYIYIFKACSFRRNEAHRTNFSLPSLFSSRFESLSSSPLLYPTAQRRASVVGSATNRITNSRHNKKSRFQSVARPRFVPCLFGQMPRPDYPVALHLATFNVGQTGLARLQID